MLDPLPKETTTSFMDDPLTNENRMSNEEKFVQLNNFEYETFFRLKFEVAGRVLHGLLELQLALPGHVQRGEEVRNQAQED
jgi:hypothetical protein